MASLTPSPKMQFFTAGGIPLVGGKLYTYAAGTTTPLATYTDSTGASANTNPVILDSRGEANVWLGVGSYKMVLKDSVDTLIWTVDNILNVNQLSSYTVASLPIAGNAQIAYAINGRKVGQTAGNGTGVPVYYSSGAWRRFSDDSVVAA